MVLATSYQGVERTLFRQTFTAIEACPEKRTYLEGPKRDTKEITWQSLILPSTTEMRQPIINRKFIHQKHE